MSLGKEHARRSGKKRVHVESPPDILTLVSWPVNQLIFVISTTNILQEHAVTILLLYSTGVGKCPFLGILNITFPYLLEMTYPIISPIVG